MITQARIDALKWFHDFDFPGGLKARSADRASSAFHTILWHFIGEELRRVDFSGKAVIDVGCWDGYFSFLAEELGADHVLAVDDYSQNWGTQECFQVAKALKRSQVRQLPDVSVYTVSERVAQRFNIVLFLGVYYHLHAPYAAFAQIRHLCREDAVVVIEGDCLRDEARAYATIDLTRPGESIFIPTTRLLVEMLHSCYLQVESMRFLGELDMAAMLSLIPASNVLDLVRQRLRVRRSSKQPQESAEVRDRVMIVAQPFSGANSDHAYKPPFGLAQFDPRWK